MIPGVRLAAFALAALSISDVSVARAASPSPAASVPTPVASPTVLEDAVPDQYVRGQLLTIGHGFIIFTTGDALRLRPGTVVPKGTTVGSLIRLTIDQLTRDVKAIELEPRTTLAGEVDATSLGKQYVVRAAASAAHAAATDAPPPVTSELVTVTLLVSVPANTPVGDTVYLSTERSGFNPSEVRMDQVDARHYTIKMSVPGGSRLHYQFTRGSNATVERERSGDISRPHEIVGTPGQRVEDTVARWADLN